MTSNESFFIKLAKSSNEFDDSLYILNNKDIIYYFNLMVNDSKFISVQRYDLEIISDTESNCENIILFDSKANKFIFNKGLLYSKMDDKSPFVSSYDFNLKVLEIINSIIAKIELLRMVKDEKTYKIEPVFYTYLIRELLDYNNEGILIQHYIKLRKLQLTSYILNYAQKTHKFNFIRKINYDIMANKEIIDTFNPKNGEIPIYDAINYESNINDDDIKLYFDDYKPEIIKRFGANVAHNYYQALKNATKIKTNNLLNCILLGKPIKNMNSIVKVSNYKSIFEHAQEINDDKTQKLIKKLIK